MIDLMAEQEDAGETRALRLGLDAVKPEGMSRRCTRRSVVLC